MLKMTIDNEEVVSKNNFSIKEEMLSASSTILNNTYPATWEQDHDYTSRFYYPKDYSKMVLNREVYTPPEEGSNVEIDNFTQLTDVDNSKEASITYLKGQTEQTTTTGKNKLPFPYTQNTTTINSVYCKVEQDGRVWTSGTASGIVQFNLYGGVNTHAANFLPNGTYILTGGYNSNKKITLRIERGSSYTYIDCDGTPKTFTIDSDVTALWCYVNIASGQGTGIYFYPMIRLSSVSDATYEPYTGGITGPNPEYPQLVKTATGNEIINVASKNLYQYGDLEESSSWYFVDKLLLANFKNNTTYTLSFDIESSIEPFSISLGYGSTGFQADGPSTGQNQYNGHKTFTFTTNRSDYKNLYMRIPRYGTQGTSWTASVKNIQLEEAKNYINKNVGTTINGKYAIDISDLEIGESYTFRSNLPINTLKISNAHDGWNSVVKIDNNGFTSYTFTMAKDSHIAETATQYLFIKLNSSAWVSSVSELSGYEFRIEKANITATDFEPYKNTPYSVNLGKNLLLIPNNNANGNGLTFSWGGNSIRVNGTNTKTDTAWISLSNSGSSTYARLPNFMKGETYTISSTNITSSSQLYFQINYYKGDTTNQGAIVSFNLSNASQTFTIPQDFGRVASMFLGVYATARQINNYSTKIMIERGSTATEYADYFEPIELCKIGDYQDFIRKGTGVNIWNGETELGSYDTSTGQKAVNSSCRRNVDYIAVEPNTTYVLSRAMATFNTRYFYYDADKTMIGTNVKNSSITTPDNCYYINFHSDQLVSNYACLMLEKSSTPTLYEPYNYKDKWYLYKAIGKVVLNGSESTWGLDGGNRGFTLNGANEKFTNRNINVYDGFCNYFNVNKNSTTWGSINYCGWNTTNTFWIREDGQIASTVANFKTWLSTHNTIVYYVLNTPTTTEITNTNLINELESIKLINGTNNITITSENLTPLTGLHYNYITENTLNELIFSGIVKNTSNISLNPREPKYCSLQILDNKTLLSEGNTLDYVINNKTILEAIEMVVNSISSYGFILGNVNILNGNEIIGTYSTENKTAYDVLQYLADISGAKWNCRRIDENTMAIDFYDPSLMPRGKDIKYTTQWQQENDIVDLQFNYGTRDYRNKQIINSDQVIGDIDYTERVASDGMTKDFVLSNNIAKVDKVEIDGVKQTFATNEEKDIGIYADFYYSANSNTITANKTLPYGSLIDITYTPIIKGREVVQNDNEIDRIATQLDVNGTISRYENRNDETNSNKLLAIANTYLKYKGEAEITLTLKTHNNDLYQVGQTVYFDAPIEELKKDYLVKSKEIDIVANNGYDNGNDLYDIFYTFTLSSSFNSEKAVNWFDNQRAKTGGNIGEGEYISRNIDINNNATIIWDNLQIEELSLVQGNNDISAPVDAPIIH